MKLKLVVTTAVLIAVGLAVPVEVRSSAHTAQLLENKQCQKCDLTGAEVKGARQERQEQRQQQQNIRQERQDQQQQQPNAQPSPQPSPQPDARQERQEQRQQRQDTRQERQNQQQQKPNPQPDARQERQEQRQQRQDTRQERQNQQQQKPNLQPDARQERQEQRQQRQDTRQERQEQRQDQRQDAQRERRRERDAWWLRENQTWWLQENEAWWHQYGESVYPVQTVRSIKVHLISLTQDKVKVLIEGVNGRQEIAFDGRQTRQTVYLSPGTHKLWFKDTRGSSWISGTLNLGRTNQIRIAFHKGKRLVQVCDDHEAWIEERYFPTESLQLNRIPIECPEIR